MKLNFRATSLKIIVYYYEGTNLLTFTGKKYIDFKF